MRTLVLAMLLVGCVSAHGEITIYGAGAESCAKWSQTREESDARGFVLWVLGWLSGAGYYDVARIYSYNKSGELVQTDSEAIAVWVDDYCRENPRDQVSDAAKALVKELAQRAE